MTFEAVLRWFQISAGLVGVAAAIALAVTMRPWLDGGRPNKPLVFQLVGAVLAAIFVGLAATALTVVTRAV